MGEQPKDADRVTAQMTALDLSPEAVAKMLDGVTPGPWTAGFDEAVLIKSGRNTVASIRVVDLYRRAPMAEVTANARFIAWAREAVPALSARLAEVEAAKAAENTGTCLLPNGQFLSERCRGAAVATLTPDAKAALDAYVVAAVLAERQRCADVARRNPAGLVGRFADGTPWVEIPDVAALIMEAPK